MARLTRLPGEDLHGQLFDRSFRGYDCGQVDHLITQCRDLGVDNDDGILERLRG